MSEVFGCQFQTYAKTRRTFKKFYESSKEAQSKNYRWFGKYQ